jgi:hypothetical protein
MNQGKAGRRKRYHRATPGNRFNPEHRMGMPSIRADTLPTTCRRVKRVAAGKISQKTSRHLSPPRIPVNQSWTSATRICVFPSNIE